MQINNCKIEQWLHWQTTFSSLSVLCLSKICHSQIHTITKSKMSDKFKRKTSNTLHQTLMILSSLICSLFPILLSSFFTLLIYLNEKIIIILLVFAFYFTLMHSFHSLLNNQCKLNQFFIYEKNQKKKSEQQNLFGLFFGLPSLSNF